MYRVRFYSFVSEWCEACWWSGLGHVMMAASLPVSPALLSPAVPGEGGWPEGPVEVPAGSHDGLPEGPDPDVVAEYVLFHSFWFSFLIFRVLFRVILRVAGLGYEVSVRVYLA